MGSMSSMCSYLQKFMVYDTCAIKCKCCIDSIPPTLGTALSVLGEAK
ncbi:predicted protein [Sclerotinia sclerotiorum 1980 UF-70]|uniref:Uncharacterized protein n=1 Tax=Sclerotinia sclerotiorum (strain ATCC 18683 / 1980 / Ss-1) TaxID=665079 RepID=A7F9E6_SCLS1|nr:predicted protein [Sclerotinia sclerotiorum 1980 UF-70]EDO00357.1 predicted protein [Sclerotinia sclerotiorum 1980 UF-70]